MVSADNGDNLNTDPIATPPVDKKRSGWITGAVILGVVAIVGVAAGYVVSQFGAGGDSSLTAIPADADMVIRLNLDQYDDQVNDLIHAFTVPLAEAGEIDDPDIDLLQLLDQELNAEAGITYSEDIAPWIGSDASAAIFFDTANMAEDPDFIIAIGVADKEKAEEFITGVIAEEDPDFETSDKGGGTLYSSTTGGPDQGYIWVGDDVMLAANTEAGIDRALAVDGDSILTNEEYEAVDAELPDATLFEAYVSSAVFDELMAQAAVEGADQSLEVFGEMGGSGMAMSVVDSGLRFDTVQISTSEDNPFSGYVFSGANLVEALPADTFGYLGYTFPEGYFETLAAQMTDGGDEFTGEIVGGFEQMFGVDLFEELLPSIGPNAILAVVESDDGMIADEFGLPVGLLLAVELSDPEPMNQVISGLEAMAAAQGIEVTGDDVKTVIVDGTPVAALTITDDELALATSSSLLDTFLSGTSGLTDSELYQELDGAVAGDGLQTYFDLESIFDQLPIPADERAVLAPIRGFGAAGEVSGDVVTGQALLLIDY